MTANGERFPAADKEEEMKKAMVALLAALWVMLGAAVAEESVSEVKLEGVIEAAVEKTILAPYSGVVGDFTASPGDVLASGDALFAIRTTPVYADFDGTVTAVFAQPGDSAASVQERYGALAYMEQTSLYTADCSTTGADSDNENRIVHVGERVYIRSSSNRDRHGEAVVTSVSGKQYTLEVLSEKDMRLGESIKVYRDEDFVSSSCIGSGDLSRVDPKSVTAEGYVLAVHVQPGQQVSRGDLLFEIVPDRLNGMRGGDGSVSMPEDGVLLSISAQSGQAIAKDAPMATYCPRGQVKLVCAVDEDEIASVEVGDELSVTLDAYDGETLKGTVVRIAGASVSGEGAPAFDVTLELEESEHVRIGMNATAVK